MAPKKYIPNPENFPEVPFSAGVVIDNTLYCSGGLGLNTETMEMGTGIQEQTTLALEHLKSVIVRAGFEITDVVNVTVYLKNLEDFQGMNDVYATYFSDDKPARTTIGVSDLLKGSLVEISCIAVKSK